MTCDDGKIKCNNTSKCTENQHNLIIPDKYGSISRTVTNVSDFVMTTDKVDVLSFQITLTISTGLTQQIVGFSGANYNVPYFSEFLQVFVFMVDVDHDFVIVTKTI